ncbi:MAG TPA: hypothetical protein DCP08_00080 [Chloroflexi bacterium]|nr:hypothetical protein [Chloroflexota bacterium]
MTLRTEIAQGRMIEGVWQERPPNLEVAAQPSFAALRPRKGSLHILVEVAGPPRRDEVSRQLVNIIRDEYFRVPGGITNGLRQGVRAANEFLYQRNQELSEGMPYVAGISCAVLSDDHLYLGQGGPAFACVVRQGEMRAFPHLPWAGEEVSEEERLPLSPLGVEERLVEVGLYHHRLEAEDVVVLSSPTLPERVGRKEFREALAPRAKEVLANLAELVEGGDFSAIVIKVSEEIPRPSEEAARAPEVVAGLAEAWRGFFSRLKESDLLGDIGERLQGSLSALPQALGTLTRRMLPEEYAREPRAKPSARRARRERLTRKQRRNLFIILGLLLVVGMGALWGVRQWRIREAQEALFQDILTQAEERLRQALAATEPSAAREFLAAIESLLEEAREMKPEHPDIEGLESRVLERQDELDHVTRLALRQPLEFPEARSAPLRVVAQDNDLYILDGGTDRLCRYRWSEAARTLQTPPEGAILIDSKEQGELLDIVWLEPGGGRERGTLLILKSDGLLEYDPLKGLSSLSVVETASWQEPRRAGGFEGNFYLLDAGAKRIFKYLPTERGYNSAPLHYIVEAEFESAVDMAIDGDIYVLLAEGVIMKFTAGKQEPFVVEGLEEEFSNPLAIFTNPGTDNIYVVESGRIVELSKEGRFVRQLRPSREEEEAFQELSTVFVDEGKGRLFILSGKRLYLADLPME